MQDCLNLIRNRGTLTDIQSAYENLSESDKRLLINELGKTSAGRQFISYLPTPTFY